MTQIPPKLALINDLTGFGRCSLAVAIPVVSALKVQACPVPTALFSNHMAFPTWAFRDLTDTLPDYLDGFSKLGLSFDGICCGFLGSVRQAEIAEQFFRSQPDALIILDPVMADHGKLYSSVMPDYCVAMKKLVAAADIITPNITEACLLTDTPYTENGWNEENLSILADALHDLGPAKVVITGIREQDNFTNFVSMIGNTGDDATPSANIHSGTNVATAPVRSLLSSPIKGQSRPGTGDIFASIIAADALQHVELAVSVQKAASFIGHCTELSDRAGLPVKEGVLFENILGELTLSPLFEQPNQVLNREAHGKPFSGNQQVLS